MIFTVYCVSHRPSSWVKLAIEEYKKRLPKSFTFEFVYISPSSHSSNSEIRMREEGKRLIKAIPKQTHLVSLEVTGKPLSTEALVKKMTYFQEESPKVAIAIGGADGLSSDVVDRSKESWSLSALTLPHQVVKVVLAEQIYRGWSILQRHPYHRA
jgi:23S rRNA (pseudouridine1915-N3)-methyltransferase|tara:strand:- start:433 stop:897 length:465 start_codon:yes stop_codon:yes gene_type:complete